MSEGSSERSLAHASGCWQLAGQLWVEVLAVSESEGLSVSKRTWLVIVAIGITVAAGLGFFWPFSRGGNELQLPGIVEIQEVRLGSKIGGRVKDIEVEEGAEVSEKQPLVTFEVPELEAQRAQVEARVRAMEADYQKAKNGPRWEEQLAAWATVESARARLERMQKGPRDEETAKAKSDLESAQADLHKAQQDLERIERLYEKKSASRGELDAALGLRDRLQGRLRSFKFLYDMHLKGSRQEDKDEAMADWQKAAARFAELMRGTRQEEVDQAKARLDESRAKLQELLANINEAVVRSPRKAVVEVISVRKGDLVPPNQPVVRVLYREDLWVKAYVPEPELGKIRVGQNVEVTIDTYPGKRIPGTVTYIAPVSEFTPRNIQSLDERRHQVFAIKIRVNKGEGAFHAGMAAEVFIPNPKAP